MTKFVDLFVFNLQVMFFTPTIKKLIEDGTSVHILCLSNGNYDGLGKIREKELYNACFVAWKMPTSNITVIDHPDMQDGWINWASEVCFSFKFFNCFRNVSHTL